MTTQSSIDQVQATSRQMHYPDFLLHVASASPLPCPISLFWISSDNLCRTTVIMGSYHNKFRTPQKCIRNFRFNVALYSTTASCGFPPTTNSSPPFLLNSMPLFWVAILASQKQFVIYKIIFIGQTCEGMCMSSSLSALLASRSNMKIKNRPVFCNLYPFRLLFGKILPLISS